MKKTILALALATMIISCKKETQQEMKEGTEAVGTEMKEEMDTMKQEMDTLKTKTGAALDTAKAKMGSQMEETGKKMKEDAAK